MKAQLFILFCLLFSLNAQVLGIDLGTQFIKAALISPGKNFVIVENTRSERKTPNVISFIDGIRLFEDEALGKKIRYPKSTFADLNVLLPLLDDPTLKVEYPHKYEIREGYKNRTIVFQIEDQQVWLEQLYGMILKNIKSLASKQAGTEIKDVVITVPGDWGLGARNAILNAANIGGLSVLSILRSNTAAALNYAMTRNDAQPLNVMFINAGSFSLEISIAQLWGEADEKGKTIESVKILSYTTTDNLSGYFVDQKLATILADKFQAKHKVDLRTNQRSWDTLVAKSSDVKQTLSANKETSVYIQGVYEGIDLHFQVTRKQLQDACPFHHLITAIESTLNSAGLSKDQIASVELIGGVSRIPKFISLVTDFFKPIEVGTHINGDECMALGGVLHAANMSITFKVKKIHLYDGWPFSLSANIIGKSSEQTIFNEEIFGQGAPNTDKKEVIVKFGDEQKLTVKIIKQGEQIRQFDISNLQDWKTTFKGQNLTKDPQLILTFASSSSQIVSLKGHIAVYSNQTKIKEITDYVKELLEQKQEQKEQAKQEEQQAQKVEQQNKQEQAQKQQNQEQKQKQQVIQQKPQKKKKFKTVSVKKNLTLTEQKVTKFNVVIDPQSSKYRKFSQHETSAFHQAGIRKYEEKEQSVKQRAEIKNNLESKLYFLKSSFDQEFVKVFSTAEELEKLKTVVEEKLEWLDENSYSGTTYEFKKQFNSLLKHANPIFNRSTEYHNRGKAVNETFEYLQVAYSKTLQLNTTNSWLGQKIENLLIKINETAKGIIQKLQQLKKQPLNEDPVIYNAELFKRAQKLREQYYVLSIIPKPKKEKKPKIVIETPKEEQVQKAETKQTAEQEIQGQL